MPMHPPARRKARRSWKDKGDPQLGTQLLAKLVGRQKTLFGVPLTSMPDGQGGTKWFIQGTTEPYSRARDAVLAYLNKYSPARQFGQWRLMRSIHCWMLVGDTQKEIFFERPSRKQIAAAIRRFRAYDSKPSYRRPDTLGWRTWTWDRKHKCLRSGVQHTLWKTPELIVENWDTSEAVRGRAGIHACRLPKGDWKEAAKPHDMPAGLVLGLVERFGKFVLGKEGWRAEWVIIKELMAPSEAVAETLRKVYPEVVVHVAPRGHWLTKGI